MRDKLGPGTTLGYCTNVHPGATLSELKANLDKHSVAAKERLPTSELGVGLWLPAACAAELARDSDEIRRFRDWLCDRGLIPFTLNGFPYGDFHSEVVKDDVYRPNWAQIERVQYTLQLAEILASLVEPGATATISTVPIGWPRHMDLCLKRRCGSDLDSVLEHLGLVSRELARLRDKTGVHIDLALEPEPCCTLSRSSDVKQLWELIQGTAVGDLAREFLSVCHDVCHASVMYEEQLHALRSYSEAGVRVSKVQISSAPNAHLDRNDAQHRQAVRQELARFAEPRYLHQTGIRRYSDKIGQGTTRWHDDLPKALELSEARAGDVEWRVHFHVPIYLDQIGPLGTTQHEILPAIKAARELHDCKHFEVETYAWNVLPKEHQRDTLAEGIADELLWMLDLAKRERIAELRPSKRPEGANGCSHG